MKTTGPLFLEKVWQVEDTLDELNEEFLQLTAHALELQREEDKPGQPSPSEGSTFMMSPTDHLLSSWAVHSVVPRESQPLQ